VFPQQQPDGLRDPQIMLYRESFQSFSLGL
jgi:hypothetical protein